MPLPIGLKGHCLVPWTGFEPALFWLKVRATRPFIGPRQILSLHRLGVCAGTTSITGCSHELVGMIGFEPIQRLARDLQSRPALQLRRIPEIWHLRRDLNPQRTDRQSVSIPRWTRRYKFGGCGWTRTNSVCGGGFTIRWGYQFSYTPKIVFAPGLRIELSSRGLTVLPRTLRVTRSKNNFIYKLTLGRGL